MQPPTNEQQNPYEQQGFTAVPQAYPPTAPEQPYYPPQQPEIPVQPQVGAGMPPPSAGA